MSTPNSHSDSSSPADAASEPPFALQLVPEAALPWVVLTLLGIALLLVYGWAFQAPFIFDDIPCIGDNPSIMQLWPLVGERGHAPLNPPQDYTTSGRPLVNLSLALNVFVGGLDPVGFHIFNLLAHLLTAMLLWAIVRRTLRLDYFGGRFDGAADVLALLVALLWALHPLQTEAVEYVSQRTEVLMGLFYLATLYASLRYFTTSTPRERAVWSLLAAGACVAGMACKEVMVSAPVIVLLFERTFIAGSFRRAARASWPLYLGLATGWLLLLALNLAGPRSATAGFHVDVPAHAWWLTQAKVLVMYLELTFWPWPLLIHYEMPYFHTLEAAWPWVLGVAALAAATLVLCWRRAAAGFLGAWVFAILSPTLVVPIITEVAAERRMYLPLAAIAALVVVRGYALIQSSVRRLAAHDGSTRLTLGLVTVSALVVAVVFGLVSERRLEAYEDGITIWQDELAYRPDDHVAQINLGVELLNAGKPDQAIEHFERALEIGDQDAPKAHLELGTALLRTDRLPEAIDHLRLALQAVPDSAKAHGYLGHALLQSGQLPAAIDHFRQSLALMPDSAEIEQDLGAALLTAGQPQESIGHLQRALRLKPDYADAHRNLGVALGRLGVVDAAAEHLEEAVRLRPESAEGHQFLAVALINMNRTPEAIRHLEKALRLGLNTADVHHYFGIALFNAGRVNEAIEQFELALQLNPDHAGAKRNLEQARQSRQRGN